MTRLFFGLLAVVYVSLFPYLRFLNNPNEHTRTYLVMALVDEGTFAITTSIRRFGYTNDLAARTVPETNRFHYFGVKAPATSYLGVPVYAVFRALAPRLGIVIPTADTDAETNARYLEHVTHVLRVFCVQLPCFAFLVLFERFLRGRTRDLSMRLAAVAAVGLGTNFMAYAMMFTSHALFACAAFGSFAITTIERERTTNPAARRLTRAFAAAFLASFCTLLEYHAAGVSLVLGLYAVFTFRRPLGVLLSGIAAAICASGLLVYQWKSFGDPLTPGHKMQVNAAFAAIHARGVNGVGAPDLDALGALAFDPGFGAFVSSPFLALGLLAIPFGLFYVPHAVANRPRERLTHFVWLVLMAGLFLLVSGVYNWRGGWGIGPRYLGAVPPFFAFGAVTAATYIAGRSPMRRTVMRALMLGCATASVLVTGTVSLLVNTLPEDITRPLTQFAIPMLRLSFVPHHVLELASVDSVVPVFVVGCLGLVALGLAFVAALERRRPHTWLALPLAIAVAYGAMLPAWTTPEDHDRQEVARAVALFARRWEPSGRDVLTATRARLRYREGQPCEWHALARLEESVGLTAEAAVSRARAGVPRARCERNRR